MAHQVLLQFPAAPRPFLFALRLRADTQLVRLLQLLFLEGPAQILARAQPLSRPDQSRSALSHAVGIRMAKGSHQKAMWTVRLTLLAPMIS